MSFSKCRVQSKQDLLELDQSTLGLNDRLLRAAERIAQANGNAEVCTISSLRPEQQPAIKTFAEFLLDLATGPKISVRSRFGRIVLPPRTGKTVVAAHLIAQSGLRTTFIVPTKNLVRQVTDELQAHLPGVPVGMYYGEVKKTVEHGVNVATYAILQHRYRRGALPQEIRDSALVIVDEAHHALTKERIALLREGFREQSLRIGLTATPDYNSTRRLCHHFPRKISEVGLYDAFELGLLAPLRFWVAEVDLDASKVRLIAGDYDCDTLGHLMSAAPVFKAVEVFRYHEDNRSVPAMVACASRRQAYDLKAYLDRHRPTSSPKPAVILGETPEDDRMRILEGFQQGRIDTLIQVGVLIEGWNSPRCKLLIDIAPSRSRVRATQKFFRVMTKNGDAEARIYIVFPSTLEAMPLLPTDLFGNPFQQYECGDLFVPNENVVAQDTCRHLTLTPIKGVKLKKRIRFYQRLTTPVLDRDNRAHIRRILESAPAFDSEKPCSFIAFHSIRFNHALFVGTGGLLLDHCRIRDRTAYWDWLTQLFPESMANIMLGKRMRATLERTNSTDLARLLTGGADPPKARWMGWLALGGRSDLDWSNPEEFLMTRETYAMLWEWVSELKLREQSILISYFGLDRNGQHTFCDLAQVYDLSSGRVAQILAKSIRKLRRFYKIYQRQQNNPFSSSTTAAVQR